jgi:uncharacterized protein YukE/F0F1-type ATP synthase delta subunit
MSGVETNLASIAEEYSEISTSLHQLLDNLEGTIETIQTTFDEGQVPEVDALVTTYYELEGDLEEFDREVEKLVNLLEGEYDPDSIDEIEKIERTSETLVQSLTEFGDRCEELATTFSANGLENQAAAFRELASSVNNLPGTIRESLFDNNLVLSIKAEQFPEEFRGEVDELVEELESAPAEQRQNTYGALVMIANKDPAAVAPYEDQLIERLTEEPPEAQQNLLTILTLTARAGSDNDVAKEQALNLLNELNPALSVKAATLLTEQPLTTNEADQIVTRMKALLDESTNQSVRVNSTFVMYTLATSHPEVIRDYASDIASLLNDQIPGVVENTIGTLRKLGCAEHADRISEIRAHSDDPEVRAEAEEALQQFDTTN